MQDYSLTRGTTNNYKDDRGQSVLLSRPVIGIVKKNKDPVLSGRIKVYINRLNSYNQDDERGWTTVNYMSPYFGYTITKSPEGGDGEYPTNQHSYGFWATSPDIGTEVICIFINGDINFGYYIGCVPSPSLIQMVPAIGSSSKKIVANGGESESYGGAKKLPVTEYNKNDEQKFLSTEMKTKNRTVHSHHAANLFTQGLIKDTKRGTIGTTSIRESPSHVFGISTPGKPITDDSEEESGGKPKPVIGRKGGHSIVLDDGDKDGEDVLIRIRTAAGHQILLHDKEEFISVIASNGKSWIELNKEGALDIFTTNSVNMRTNIDINIHSERDINMEAKRNFNIKAEKINLESTKETLMRSGEDYKIYSKQKYTVKADDAIGMESAGDLALTSTDASVFIKGGPNVNINGGSSPVTPQEVEEIEVKKYADTILEGDKGWISVPNKIESITSRVPTHWPYKDANKGVDAESDNSAENELPEDASNEVDEANQESEGTSNDNGQPGEDAGNAGDSAIAGAMDGSTSPALARTAVGFGSADRSALLSQVAVSSGYGDILNGIGNFKLDPRTLEQMGVIKPGTAAMVLGLIGAGLAIKNILKPNMFTGRYGSSYQEYTRNQNYQKKSMNDLMDKSEKELIKNGILTGKEAPNQKAGIILATTVKGIDAVKAYVKKTPTPLTGQNQVRNPEFSSIAKLIKYGNRAVNMVDKNLSGMKPYLIKNSPKSKGSVSDAFDIIINSFKPLPANTGVDLDAFNAQRTPEEIRIQATQTQEPVPVLPQNINITAPQPVIPVTMQYATCTNLCCDLESIPKFTAFSKIQDANNNNVQEKDYTDLINFMKLNKVGLLDLVNYNLATDALIELDDTLNSISTGSPRKTRVPVAAENTDKTTSKINKVYNKLVDPTLTTQERPVDTVTTLENQTSMDSARGTTMNATSIAITSLKYNVERLRQQYLILKENEGEKSSTTVAALNAYKTELQKLMNLTGDK